MLLLAALLGSANVLAQAAPYPVNCGQLTLEVVPKPYTGSNDGASCNYCCIGQTSCERIEYQVFLRAKDTPSGSLNLPNFGNFDISYTELLITLNLSRGTNSVASSINEAFTEACLASYLSSIPTSTYSADVDEDEVSLQISITQGLIPFQDLTNNSSCDALSDGYLFSIIVDAFPGESLGISCKEFTYLSAQPGGCAGTCSGIGNTPFPMPGQVNSAISISLGAINCNDEEYIDLPVTVSSTIAGMDISSLDFAVVITTTAPDGFYDKPQFIDILLGTNPNFMARLTTTGDYIVKLRYAPLASIPINGANIELGKIRIYRPSILCQGYTISASLVPGRVRLLGGANSGCRAIQMGAISGAQCTVPPMDICTDDFQFNITTEQSLTDCEVLKIYATLSWDPDDFMGATSLQFLQLRSIIDFKMANGVTIANAQLEGFSCPGSGNAPVKCPGNCLQWGGNTVELCINVGSSITVANNARIVVTFNAPQGCIASAVVRKMTLKRPGGNVCQPDVNPPVGFPYCNPTLTNFISGNIADDNKCWIEEVIVKITAPSVPACNRTFLTGTGATNAEWCAPYTSGCLCSIATAGNYTVTPEKNDNPLNGVTTFDLVLISKHILGIEPLNTPYKMIAADVNKSGSVTTFDIVELRKLILGIYSELPENTSWRFVDKAFDFPNLLYPFQTNFPEFKVVSSLPSQNVNFRGIKIGDLNLSAIVSCTTCTAPKPNMGNYLLTTPRRRALKSGDIYTLPIRAGGTSPLIAWQSAFRFDPEVLELIGPSQGDAQGLSANNFNLSQASEGIIRASWFAQPDALEVETLQPGQSLFNLSFRIKKDLSESEALLSIDEGLMPNLAWNSEGTEYELQTSTNSSRDIEAQPEKLTWVTCRPNPSLGEVTFEVQALPRPLRAQLTVFDAFGQRVWWRDLSKETGSVEIRVPEAVNWPVGVYHWELRFDQQKSVGTFVRL